MIRARIWRALASFDMQPEVAIVTQKNRDAVPRSWGAQRVIWGSHKRCSGVK